MFTCCTLLFLQILLYNCAYVFLILYTTVYLFICIHLLVFNCISQIEYIMVSWSIYVDDTQMHMYICDFVITCVWYNTGVTITWCCDKYLCTRVCIYMFVYVPRVSVPVYLIICICVWVFIVNLCQWHCVF